MNNNGHISAYVSVQNILWLYLKQDQGISKLLKLVAIKIDDHHQLLEIYLNKVRYSVGKVPQVIKLTNDEKNEWSTKG